MKCNNYFIFSVGITALCHFSFFTQIVPCNVRLTFNKLTGDAVTFEAPGGHTLWRSRKDAICHRLEEMDAPVSSPACILVMVS